MARYTWGMTGENDTKKAPAKGTPTLQAALLLFVIGAGMAIVGGGALGWIFILGAIACAIVGLIQKDSAPR
jgi:hypothetical protein